MQKCLLFWHHNSHHQKPLFCSLLSSQWSTSDSSIANIWTNRMSWWICKGTHSHLVLSTHWFLQQAQVNSLLLASKQWKYFPVPTSNNEELIFPMTSEPSSTYHWSMQSIILSTLNQLTLTSNTPLSIVSSNHFQFWFCLFPGTFSSISMDCIANRYSCVHRHGYGCTFG